MHSRNFKNSEFHKQKDDIRLPQNFQILKKNFDRIYIEEHGTIFHILSTEIF